MGETINPRNTSLPTRENEIDEKVRNLNKYVNKGSKGLFILRFNSVISHQMADLTKNQILDFRKWYLDTPEAGFSPERNKAVIEESIRKSELLRLRKSKDYVEQVRERADAVASFLKSVSNGYVKGIDAYLGRKELSRLRGQQILQEIKDRSKRMIGLRSLD